MAKTILLTAGACLTSSGLFNKCALQPVECPSAQTFRSAAWLSTNNNDVASQCSVQETLWKLQSMGRCDSSADRFICTSDKSACRFSAVFKPLATDCNLVQDFYPSNEFTNAHYGFCEDREGKNDYCVWSFKECGDPSLWEWNIADPFFANQNPDCHCDKVKTGACVSESTSDSFCAVNNEACGGDGGYTYYPVLELESQFNTTCKLCDTIPAALFEETAIEDEGKDPLDIEDSKEDPVEAADQEEASSNVASKSSNSNDSGLNNGSIVGIAIGGSLLFICLVTVGFVLINRKKAGGKEEINNPDDNKSVGTLQSIQ